MLNEAEALPEDPAQLRTAAEGLVSLVKSQALRIAKLEHQLAGLRRHRFGSTSESLDQLQLGLEDEEIAAAQADAVPPSGPTATPKGVPKRKPLPAHLPRQETVLSPGDACGTCGGKLKPLGEDVTEELDYVPGRFVVNRIVRPRLACTCCEAICQAPLPSRPIERGRPGPGLLAHVLVAKYGDHLPLYRQSQIFAREGINLDRSTLADWVGKATALLEPLADAIERHVLGGPAIFADETPIKLQAPGHGKTKTARIWTYVRDERPWLGPGPPAACYRFTVDRKGEHPASHLQGFRGWMHADGYSGFNELYRSGGVREVACLAQTIRTQSGTGRHGGAGWAIGGVGIAQRDDMADFQRVFVDDDALDDELQDSLAVAEVGILEPRADPFAEGGHVRQHGMSTNALFDQAAALVALLDGGAMLFGNRPTPLSQLLEADHFSLVSLEQPLVGPCQAVEPGLELTRHRLILWAPVRRLGNEALELGDQPLRVAEQADDVVPHRPLDHLGIDHRPRAFGVAPGRQRIDAGAAVVATLNSASRPSKAAAVDGEPTDATLQQAAQEVV